MAVHRLKSASRLASAERELPYCVELLEEEGAGGQATVVAMSLTAGVAYAAYYAAAREYFGRRVQLRHNGAVLATFTA
ncbi:hypothetical protein [Phenylobacterium sp.]|jgi:hypothetical protein|uniref:hypothetical protein n=1 Tax=Phenylobacterium sp. TaxID=1871053 RepID=UPI002F95AE59